MCCISLSGVNLTPSIVSGDQLFSLMHSKFVHRCLFLFSFLYNVLCIRRSWQELGLPVCPQSILKAREYVCHLVEVFVKYSLMEASKIEGALLSLKCVRTKQVSYKKHKKIKRKVLPCGESNPGHDGESVGS